MPSSVLKMAWPKSCYLQPIDYLDMANLSKYKVVNVS